MKIPTLVRNARKFYTFHQCKGVLKLIDYLLKPENAEMKYLGTCSILYKKSERAGQESYPTKSAERASLWYRSGSLYIGDSKSSVTPVKWLKKYSRDFVHLSPRAKKKFDAICYGLVLSPEQKAVPAVRYDEL